MKPSHCPFRPIESFESLQRAYYGKPYPYTESENIPSVSSDSVSENLALPKRHILVWTECSKTFDNGIFPEPKCQARSARVYCLSGPYIRCSFRLVNLTMTEVVADRGHKSDVDLFLCQHLFDGRRDIDNVIKQL